MSDWKEVKLGDILNFISKGTTPPKGVGFVDKGINYVKSDAIGYDRKLDKTKIVQINEETHQKFKRSQLAENDILFSMAGIYLGKNAIVTKDILPANTNQALAILRLNQEEANPNYVSLYLSQQSMIDFINNMSGQSAQPNVNFEEIKSIEIKLPPLLEQTAIASVLSSLDDKIDLLHRQNATIEKMAETLFRQWFVEEAKEEWINGKVSDLIKILSGFAFKSSSFVESGKYRLITIKGVQDGYLELNNADKIEELPDRMPDFCKLQIGDILLSLTGNVGRCCLVDTTDLLLNQRVAKLHPINERDRAYTYFLFRQPQIKQLLEEMGKGTAQSNLSPIETSNMELITPDKEKLTEFSTIATPWLNKLLFNKKAIQTLSNLRDSLLPKLMSGEVTVEI